MVVGFTTTYAIRVYHHSSCDFEPRSWGGELNITLCDKVCQWFVTGRWFSPGTPVSFSNKTDRHDINEWNKINHDPNPFLPNAFDGGVAVHCSHTSDHTVQMEHPLFVFYILFVVIILKYWFWLWCLTPLSTIFSYIEAVSFIGGGIRRKIHRPVASHSQTLSHNVVSCTPSLNGIRTHNVSLKSNTITTAPLYSNSGTLSLMYVNC